MNKYLFIVMVIISFILISCRQQPEQSKDELIQSEPVSEGNVKDEFEMNKKQLITSENFEDIVKEPDSIIYYHNGNESTITKDDVLFSEIYEEVKNRFNGELGIYKSDMEYPEGMDEAKKNKDFLEVIYNSEITIDIQDIFTETKEIKYTSLLFPLTDKFTKAVIFMPWVCSPLGELDSSDKLVEILDKIN